METPITQVNSLHFSSPISSSPPGPRSDPPRQWLPSPDGCTPAPERGREGSVRGLALCAPSLFFLPPFHNPPRDQPSCVWGTGCWPWPCGLYNWLLFLSPPLARGKSVGLTGQWQGRRSNRQSLACTQAEVYLLQGNLSSLGKPSTDPLFQGWGREIPGQRNFSSQ